MTFMPAPSALTTDGLVKNNLAERSRAEIISGAFPPGARIIEGKWAGRFGVAQGSIREAINILAQDGFVTKESGRSARVIHLSERAVTQLYELRGAVEGLAARLAVSAHSELTALQATVDTMRHSARREIAKACSITIYDFTSDYARSRATPLYWSTRAAFCCPSLHLCECE